MLLLLQNFGYPKSLYRQDYALGGASPGVIDADLRDDRRNALCRRDSMSARIAGLATP